MKLTIDRSTLLGALSHTQNVVERRNTIPILSNLQLVAETDSLNLTATDLDLAMVETVEADIQQTGGTTAPAHILHDIVRKLPDGAQVELDSTDGSRMVVRSGRSNIELSCLPREDFPLMADDDLPHQFVLPSLDLHRLIEQTRFAISTEETRYYLNGIFLHAPEDAPVLRGVATDGHRLAHVEVPLPSGAAGMPGGIIPRKAAIEVDKQIERGDVTVDIALSNS